MAFSGGHILRAAAGLCIIGACHSPAAPNNPPQSRTSTTDQPDDVAGNQVHLLYVLPKDGVDNHLDSDGTITASVQLAQSWLAGQTSPSRRLRLDLYHGTLDITFVRLNRTDAEYVNAGVRIREEIATDLAGSGFLNDSKKIYSSFYGGGSPQGGTQVPCAQGALGGNNSAVYVGCFLARSDIQSLISTHGLSKILGMAWVHEILHNLGAVPSCAPHQSASHSTDDPRDLMVASGSTQFATYRDPSFLPLLDAGHDDYYQHTIPGCTDVANHPIWEAATQNGAGNRQ